jgi:hypothetical protein
LSLDRPVLENRIIKAFLAGVGGHWHYPFIILWMLFVKSFDKSMVKKRFIKAISPYPSMNSINKSHYPKAVFVGHLS